MNGKLSSTEDLSANSTLVGYSINVSRPPITRFELNESHGSFPQTPSLEVSGSFAAAFQEGVGTPWKKQ